MLVLMTLHMTACSSGEGSGSIGSEKSITNEESETEQSYDYNEYIINTAMNRYGLESTYKKNTAASFSGWGFLPDNLITGAGEKDGIVIIIDFTNSNDKAYQFSDIYGIKAYQNDKELEKCDSCEAGVIKCVDDYATEISSGENIQIAEVYKLIDESPVTVQLYEKTVPSNYVQSIIDLSRSSDETYKNIEKYTQADIEKIVTSYSMWEMTKPMDEFSYMAFSFSLDGTGTWYVDSSAIPITWKSGKNNDKDADVLYVVLMFFPESEGSNVADYFLNFGEDAQGPYLFFDYENYARPK